MRAVINTLFPNPSLGADLKRQMVLIKEENIKLFHEEEKNVSRKIPKSLPKKERFVGCV